MQGHALTFQESELSLRAPAAISLPIALVSSIALLAVLALLIRRVRQHRERADDARAVMDRAKTRELRPGLHVVAGRVHTAGGGPAIRVRIRESGREWNTKNGMRHRWTEVAREVDAHAFELITSAGTVRVEPDASVKLVDLLATVRRPAENVREREASLDPGEEVFVSGLLRRTRGGDGAYRGGDAPAWVMRAPPNGTLVCSTEPLSEPHERWAAFYRRAALWGALLCAVVIGFLSVTYFPLALAGSTVDAEVVQLQHATTRGQRGRTVHHYTVLASARLPDGRVIELRDEVRRDAWIRLREGDVLPFVVLRSHPALHQIGRRAGIGDSVLVAGVVLLGTCAFMLELTRRRRRAWWEMEKIVTTGAGPLEDH